MQPPDEIEHAIRVLLAGLDGAEDPRFISGAHLQLDVLRWVVDGSGNFGNFMRDVAAADAAAEKAIKKARSN